MQRLKDLPIGRRWLVAAIAIVIVFAAAGILGGTAGNPGSSPSASPSSGPSGGRPSPPSSPSPGPTPTASPSSSPTPTASPSPSPTPPPTPTPAPTATPTLKPTPNPTTTGFDPAAVAVALTSVLTVEGRPLAVTNAGDGSGRLFVADQNGRIWIVRDGVQVAQPFLDIRARVSCCGERGLLGIAFHPDFPGDPRVFVNYTDNGGDTVVSSFAVPSGTPDQADAGSETIILSIAQPYSNHNGGAIAFGKDGMLYIATGDGGSGGDPQGYGQHLDTLLGKILRIDIDGTQGSLGYAIPSSNPFVGQSGARDEIWLYGLRNPWRISFDRSNGDLWIGDVGQGNWEEIDVNRASAGGGANFGWNTMEGNHCYPIGSSCSKTGLKVPASEYNHASGRCTVIGGGVYRGSAYPMLRGGYVFADYCAGTVWAIVASKGAAQAPVKVGDTAFGIAGFGEAEDGEMYAVNVENGKLYRVEATAR